MIKTTTPIHDKDTLGQVTSKEPYGGASVGEGSRNIFVRRAEDTNHDNELTTDPGDKLGIQVNPERVRLVPQSKDGYRWIPNSDQTGKLLKTHLSNQPIGNLVKLYHGVGKSFDVEAVDDDVEEQAPVPDKPTSVCDREEIKCLVKDVAELRDLFSTELLKRQKAEVELQEAQEDLRNLQIKFHSFDRKFERCSKLTESRWEALEKRQVADGLHQRKLRKCLSMIMRLDSVTDEKATDRLYPRIMHSKIKRTR